jgi:hypothetical protein
VRAFFEPRFGKDFSQVRLHTDPQAAASAKSLNASAYTIGTDIAFASGHYAPGTDSGKRLLAHELTHVVQQNPGSSVKSSAHFLSRSVNFLKDKVQRLTSLPGRLAVRAKMVMGHPGDILEKEADLTAERIMRMPEPRLMASPSDEEILNDEGKIEGLQAKQSFDKASSVSSGSKIGASEVQATSINSQILRNSGINHVSPSMQDVVQKAPDKNSKDSKENKPGWLERSVLFR